MLQLLCSPSHAGAQDQDGNGPVPSFVSRARHLSNHPEEEVGGCEVTNCPHPDAQSGRGLQEPERGSQIYAEVYGRSSQALRDLLMDGGKLASAVYELLQVDSVQVCVQDDAESQPALFLLKRRSIILMLKVYKK